MSRWSNTKLFVLVCAVLFPMLATPAFAGDDLIQWRPITPAELQMKTPTVEPDADAEAIFWEVWLDDKKYGKLTYTHYVRVKIFTERGRERFAKMDIPFMKGKKVDNVAARVIKPDGTIVELKPGDIFEREIAKAGKARVQAKSFAVPGIEPGVIVEYQYTESIKGDSAGGERLIFQRDIPMERVTYHIRPFSGGSLGYNSYNMPDISLVKDKDGFSTATMTNVPAYKEEPYMPPDDEVRKWVYLSYQNLGTLLQWTYVSMRWDNVLQKLAKPNKEVKAKAAEITAGAASDEEKLQRIYKFVQTNIRNLSYDRTLSEEQVEKMDIKDADDALKQGMGRSYHIDMLFASLAKAAGFETSLVLAGDRSENFFDINKYPFANFIEWSGVGVKIGTDWKFFDPCAPFLPFGSLTWNREDVKAMVVGNGGYSWTTTPISEPSRSVALRTGSFELLPDGTLTGTAKLEYSGQQAISRRRDDFRDSQSKREENITKEIKGHLSTAEISDLSIENFDDTSKPLTYVFKIRVPNYAQRAGKRLILQPGVFEFGSAPVFSSATRTYNIYFPYPWSENDSVQIKLPAGFEVDSADSPAEIADSKRIGSDKIVINVDKATNTLTYKRNFYFGSGGRTLFPVGAYQALKGLFDSFHKSDTYAISLKQAAN